MLFNQPNLNIIIYKMETISPAPQDCGDLAHTVPGSGTQLESSVNICFLLGWSTSFIVLPYGPIRQVNLLKL